MAPAELAQVEWVLSQMIRSKRSISSSASVDAGNIDHVHDHLGPEPSFIVYCGPERSFHASTTLILYTGKVTWKLVTDSMEFTRRHEGMKYLLQEHWGFNSVPLELDNLHHRIRSTTSPPNLTLNLRTQTDKSHHRERPPSPS